MSKKLYSVTSGSYSDYQVHAVFARKQDAEQAIREAPEKGFRDGYEISEMPYFPSGALPVVATLHFISENWWDDESRTQYNERSEVVSELDPSWHTWPDRPYVRFVRAPMHKDKGGRIEITVLDDMNLARKVYSDNKVQWEVVPGAFLEINR